MSQPSQVKCPQAQWHQVVTRQPMGVDAGGAWCEDCGEYVGGSPTTQVLGECRYCGQGWTFPAGTRQGPQEVRIHEARCAAERADRRTT